MSPSPRKLVVASRGSRLALRQARIVARLLVESHPSVKVSVTTVSTSGDRDPRPFGAIGGRGLFVNDVERAVTEGWADVAVHSAKDLTAELAPGCSVICVPTRSEVADVVIGGRGAGSAGPREKGGAGSAGPREKGGAGSAGPLGDGVTGEDRLNALPAGAKVGTSSMRRRVLLGETRPDLDVVELRGNLDTRLAKVASGEVDAAILAAAGLVRLGAGASAALLDPERWVPAPGQGALAVEALSDRTDIAELFAPLCDPASSAEVVCERAFARRLEGGCSVPLGCLARSGGGRLVATGLLGSPFGGAPLRDRISGALEDAEALGTELAAAILSAGGDEILADVGSADAVEPSAP